MKPRRMPVLVALLVMVAGCSSRRGELAPGVTKEGLKALRPGMSREEVVGLLGPPLDEKSSPYTAGLDYARKGSGMIVMAVIHSQRGLVLAVVQDLGLGKNCTCDERRCTDTWLDACAANLPSRQ